tara:strand:- start:46 stop:993 length:948 start_codon:yes stop_codon:yes gene_type:complete
MVYGEVDLSPCVAVKNIDDSSISIKADNLPIGGFNNSQFTPSSIVRSPLNFYSGSKVINISQQSGAIVTPTHIAHTQYDIYDNYLTISPEFTQDEDALPTNNYADSLLECQIFRFPLTPELVQHQTQSQNPYEDIVLGHPLSNVVDIDLSTYLEWEASGVFSPDFSANGVWFLMTHNQFESYGVEDSIYNASTYYMTKLELEFIDGYSTGDAGYQIRYGNYSSYDILYDIPYGESSYYNNFGSNHTDTLLEGGEFDGSITPGQLIGQIVSSFATDGEYNIKIYGAALWHIFEYDFHGSSSGILDKTFYVNMTGRT